MDDERGTSSLSLRTRERLFETKQIKSTAEQLSHAEIAAVDYVNRKVLSLHQYDFQNCRERIAASPPDVSRGNCDVSTPCVCHVFADEICAAQK
jgi:hypothetical protein